MAKGGQVHFGGLPTDLEVAAMRDRWPEATLKPGQRIDYGAVERAIGTERTDQRFRTITSRWRRIAERENPGVIIGVEPGKAFLVLDAKQKLGLAEGKFASAVRATRRSLRVASATEVRELSEQERARLTFVQRRAAAVLGTARLRSSAELPTLIAKQETDDEAVQD